MDSYYVNKNAQSNGDHEVHKLGCSYMPHLENRIYLGQFNGCAGAVLEAKKTYSKADGCSHCSASCHTR